MTLAPAAESSEGESNEHAWAEQWLYVVEGAGTARVGGRTVRLRAGSLLLIEKREPHVIRAGRERLVTLNVYVPPAYGDDGEPLPARARAQARTRARRGATSRGGPARRRRRRGGARSRSASAGT
jgi:glyoxylate utilization-related uncharacterized protein